MTDVSPDAFERAFTLLAVVADARGCKARLGRLKKLEERTAAAQAKLDADSASFEAIKAELEAREAAVKDREERVDAAEMALLKAQPAERFPLSANLEPGGRSYSGMSRAPYRS
jgi:chromosome segregation ATPase